MATTAVLAVVHSGHEDTSTALGLGALPPETLNLAITINFVVLEDSELSLLPLMLDLLGSGVDLLLPLLSTTTQTEDQVKSGFLLNVVVGKSSSVLKLLSGKDQALLIRRDAFFVCIMLVTFNYAT